MDAKMKFAALVSVLLALSGCVEPDQARSYDEFVKDYNRIKGISSNNTNGSTNNANNPNTNNPTNNATNQNNPVILPVPCSDNGGGPIDVQFVNRSSVTAELFWVNSDCEEFRYATLAPNQVHPQSTFVNHVWVLRDGDTALGWVKVIVGGDAVFELGQ